MNREEVYLGVYVREKVSQSVIDIKAYNNFVDNCLSFYIELCHQMKQKFDFGNTVLKNLNVINPSVILNKSTDIIPLLQRFPNLICKEKYQILENEVRELRLIDFEKNTLNFDIFWKYVSSIILSNNKPAFPNLCEFVNQLMTLPNSSANVERIFSQINLTKTKIRNPMETETLAAVLLSKDFLKNNKSDCFNVHISKRILKSHNASNLYD